MKRIKSNYRFVLLCLLIFVFSIAVQAGQAQEKGEGQPVPGEPPDEQREPTGVLPNAPLACNAGNPVRSISLANTLTGCDDCSDGPTPLGFTVNYFGTNYDNTYVNSNGNLTFGSGLTTYTPFGMSGATVPIIAPYFADVDLRGSGATNTVHYGQTTIDGRPAFVATYEDVGYFGSHTDLLNTFQIVIIDRSDVSAGSFDLEYNHSQIQWETGDASGGSGGTGGNSAVVGYSAGDGTTYYEFPGSAVNGALLDSNTDTGLIHNSQNSDICGRYEFFVRDGIPLTTVLGDFTWHDQNEDGIQGAGEPGLGGVIVNLYTDDGDGVAEPGGDDGAATATTASGTDGSYEFTGLTAGDYFLEFIAPSGYTVSPQDQGSDDALDSDADPTTGLTAVFSLNGEDLSIDAGFRTSTTSAVGDLVWSDPNADGIQNTGETGISGVTVTIYRDDGDGSASTSNDFLIGSQTTASDGTYQFDNLATGNYFIQVALPANHSFSLQDQGGDDALDSDVDPNTGLTDIFALASGQTDDSRDAGLLPPATVGDYVWEDSNSNHVQDTGESGINGVTVRIYQDDGDNVPDTGADVLVDTTTTANDGSSDGAYQFAVPAGDYFIEFDAGSRLLALPDRGGDDTLDSDADPATGLTAIFTLTPGTTNLTVDAGMSASSSCTVAVVGSDSLGYNETVAQLNDDTYHDFLASRVDPADVDTVAELSAYDALVIGYTFDTTTYTTYQSALRTWVEGGGGAVGVGFLDWDVPSGTDIDAIMPINMAGSGQYVSSGSVVITTTAHAVTAGVTDFTASSCLVEYPAGTSPYLDAGATGLATTSGIPSVAVGEPGDGRAAYLGPAYSYYSSGCASTSMRAGEADQLLENAVAWAGSCEPSSMGDYVWLDDVGLLTADYYPLCEPSSMGDYVWLDGDQDGIQDGTEVGLNGVTVNLYRDVDYDLIPEPGGDDGAPIDTTTTSNNGANDGFYQFTPDAGYYFLEFVPASALVPSAQDQGADDAVDSDIDPATSLTDVFAFSTANDAMDAGFMPDAIWDGEGVDNNWTTAANWVGDVVPGATDLVVFNTTSTKNAIVDTGFADSVSGILIAPGYTGVITTGRSLHVSNNYRQYDGTFVVADPAVDSFTVGENVWHTGGTLQQTRDVNNADIPFLQIEDGASVVKYRGVNVDTTANSTTLGSTTVSIRAIDADAGEYCTTDSASPAYAERCYEITPTTNGSAQLRLWALASELNGITEGNLAVYHWTGSGWSEVVTNQVTGNDGGNYAYAEGIVSSFSPFLLGESGSSPTAVSLQSLSAQEANAGGALFYGVLSLIALSLTVWLRRRYK